MLGDKEGREGQGTEGEGRKEEGREFNFSLLQNCFITCHITIQSFLLLLVCEEFEAEKGACPQAPSE